MRILVINWQDRTNPFAGGAEVHLHEVFSRIVGKGHHVTLLCSRFAGAPVNEVVDGMQVVRRGSRSLFNYAVPVAYRDLCQSGFDIVVEDLNKIPFFSPLFVREPLVGICHHLFRTSIFYQTNPVAAAYVFGMESLALRLYKHRRMPFIVDSSSTFQEFLAHGFRSGNLTTVHLAVNHSLFRHTGVPKSATPLVGCFGRLKRYKGVDTLLRALPAVLKEVPDLKVVIAGEGDDRPRLERLATALKLTAAVTFTGYLPEPATVELLEKAWFTVAASIKEGWGLTVTEANACGTPVIASNVPGLRDSVRDRETGLLYPYGNVEALAASMVQLVRDARLRDELGRNALAYAKEFTWDKAAEGTLAVLTRVAQKGGPR
jgi:glycosyltransferase involved in cell wall biosynthesis